MKQIISIDFLNYPKLGENAIETINSTLTNLEMEDDKRERFIAKIKEGVMLRIANAYEKEGILTAKLLLDKGRVRFALQDEGRPYKVNDSLKSNKNIEETFREIEAAINNNSNEEFIVSIEKLGRYGQQMTLTTDHEFTGNVVGIKKHELVPHDSHFNVKKVTNNNLEINEAIYCIFCEYGYSYLYEDIYKFSEFKNLLETGMFHSYLVINDCQQVAGHFGLSESDALEGMPEIGMVVIKKEFREMKFGSKIFEYAIEDAKRLKRPAIWVQPTAFHMGTQIICNRLGFTPTGIMFQYVNGDIHSEYNKEGRRLDVSMCVKFLEEREFAIYCPDEIVDFTRKTFKNLNSPVEILTPSDSHKETVISHEINQRTYSAKIIISEIGDDFNEKITDILHECQQNKLEMIELMLSMQCGNVQNGYEILKEKEFVFSGILPGGDKGVYCVMQNLCGSKPEYDKIVVTPEYKVVLDDIRKIHVK